MIGYYQYLSRHNQYIIMCNNKILSPLAKYLALFAHTRYPSREVVKGVNRECMFDIDAITAALSDAGHETEALFQPFKYQGQDSGMCAHVGSLGASDMYVYIVVVACNQKLYSSGA